MAWTAFEHAGQASISFSWCLQVVIVQFGGPWFQTHALSAQQWAACTGIGAVSLLVRFGLRSLPTANRNDS